MEVVIGKHSHKAHATTSSLPAGRATAAPQLVLTLLLLVADLPTPDY